MRVASRRCQARRVLLRSMILCLHLQICFHLIRFWAEETEELQLGNHSNTESLEFFSVLCLEVWGLLLLVVVWVFVCFCCFIVFGFFVVFFFFLNLFGDTDSPCSHPSLAWTQHPPASAPKHSVKVFSGWFYLLPLSHHLELQVKWAPFGISCAILTDKSSLACWCNYLILNYSIRVTERNTPGKRTTVLFKDNRLPFKAVR